MFERDSCYQYTEIGTCVFSLCPFICLHYLEIYLCSGAGTWWPHALSFLYSSDWLGCFFSWGINNHNIRPVSSAVCSLQMLWLNVCEHISIWHMSGLEYLCIWEHTCAVWHLGLFIIINEKLRDVWLRGLKPSWTNTSAGWWNHFISQIFRS